MSVRQDTAQLIITIDAKESVAYQKSVTESAQLVKNIKSATVGSKEYNDALAAQKRISDELAKTDYTKLSLKNLTDRRRQLVELQKQLPQNVFAEQGFAKELQQVNTAMRGASDATRATTNSLRDLDQKGGGFFKNIKNNILGVAGGFAVFEIAKRTISSLIGLGRDSLKLFDEQAKADAQIKAAIISTNGAAGRSFEELKKQAQDLQKTTLFGDEQTQQAQGILLTFTKVREEIFDRSIPAIQDYATAMDTDLKSASIQVGKALNDPIKGITALGKAGVQFSEEQKTTIARLVETGDIAAAQTIILGELETQFKGSAEAAAKAGLGPYQQFQNRMGDIKETLGGLLNEGLSRLAPAFDAFAGFLETSVTYLIAFAKAIAAVPEFIKENETELKTLALGLVFFNGQLILSSANSLRLAAAEKARLILTRAITISQNLLNAAMTANPIGLVIKAIAVLVTGFALLYQKSETVRAGISGLGEVAKEIFAIIKEAVGSFLEGFAQLKEGNFTAAFTAFKNGLVKSNPVGIALSEGKRLKEAFNRGFNDKLEAEKAQKEAEQQAKDLLAAADGAASGSSPLKTIQDTENDEAEDGGPGASKRKEKLEKQAKEEKTNYEKLLKDRLELIDQNFRKEQQLAEKAFLEGQITEDEYNEKKLEQKRLSLSNQLFLLQMLGQQDTEQFRKLEIEKLNIEKQITDERIKTKLEALTDTAAMEMEEVERLYLQGLITEEEREQTRLELLREQADRKLELLRELGLEETDAFSKVELEKLKIQSDQQKKAEENIKRHEEIKRQLQEQGLTVFKDTIGTMIDLLGQDEEARKKNAGLIKAFETARIIVAAQAEIAEIFKSVAGLGPVGWGLAGARAFLVGVRSISAIAKIQSTKFGEGGSLRDGKQFKGPSHSSGGIKLPWGDEVEGDEVIINARSSRMFLPVLDKINSYNGYGKRLFNLGGRINPNTSPAGLQNIPLSGGGNNIPGFDPTMLMAFNNAMSQFVNIMPVILSNIRATVVYNDIRNAGDTVAEIERKSQF